MAVTSYNFLLLERADCNYGLCFWEVGSFDGPFTPSELRRALGVCVDSAMGLDGVPYSLFKVPFPWWQRALLNLFNLVLSWGLFPLCGNGALWCPSSNGETPVSPPTVAPSLLRRAASNASSISSISALDRSCLPNFMSAREDSDGVLMFWSVHSLMFCRHPDLLSHSLLFVDIPKAFGMGRGHSGPPPRCGCERADVASRVPFPP